MKTEQKEINEKMERKMSEKVQVENQLNSLMEATLRMENDLLSMDVPEKE